MKSKLKAYEKKNKRIYLQQVKITIQSCFTRLDNSQDRHLSVEVVPCLLPKLLHIPQPTPLHNTNEVSDGGRRNNTTVYETAL